MKYQTKITGAILVVTAVFAAACASEEGKQTVPVSTTTGGSTTVASPAAEVRKRDFAPGSGPPQRADVAYGAIPITKRDRQDVRDCIRRSD